MKYIEDMLDVDDKMKERMSETLIKGSNFLKPKRTKNIATKGRGGRAGGTDKEPTVSELTRNYLDLDIGTMHFEVSLKSQVEQLVEQQTETKKEEMDIFDYTVELEKEGELRLAEEGAFIIADREKVEGISDILVGFFSFRQWRIGLPGKSMYFDWCSRWRREHNLRFLKNFVALARCG